MIRHLLLDLEVGDAKPDECGRCPFSVESYGGSILVCVALGLEGADGMCRETHGQRLPECIAAERP